MADINYPSVLPIPVRTGYGKQYMKKPTMAKMDDGGSRHRRKLFDQAFMLTLSWELTDSQFAIMDAFGKIICNFWTSWFMLPVSPNQGPIKAKLVGDAPDYKRNGSNWTMSGTFMCIEAGPTATGPVILGLWPSSLPFPNSTDYSVQVSNPRVEDDAALGTPAGRVRFQTQYTVFSASWILTQAERDIFWAFFRNNLYDGALPFSMPFMNGRGINFLRCKTMEMPKESSESSGYSISMTLSTQFAPVMTQTELLDALGAHLVSTYADDYFAEDYTTQVLIYD